MRATAQMREQLQAAIAGLEAQRATLGDLVVDAGLEALRRQLEKLDATPATPQSLAGERKLVTVMFADVSGYTALAENLDPERARDLLNACFETLVPIVQKYGGTIDKFVGDEIVALFGAPIAHENDAERACRAALEMMQAIGEFNREHDADLGLHFGINTGRVVAGGVGTRERQDYSVMGHAVNLAARLEDASERGEIFVGEQTQRAAAAFFEFEEMTLKVKGASAPLTAFRLLGPREKIVPTRGIAGLHSPLVGRDAEWAQLRAAIDGLQNGRGFVVAVVGEAGIGKSRLMAEARRSAPDARWHEGRTLSHSAGMSYWLLRDLLRDVLGHGAARSAAAAMENLRQCLCAVLPGEEERASALLAHFLELPGLEQSTAWIRDLTSEGLQRQTTEIIAAFLAGLSVARPLVLVLEDLHWADPSSLRMLGDLLPLAAHTPMGFLLVLRPEAPTATDFFAATAKQSGTLLTRIELKPLSGASSERLLRNLLAVDNMPEELQKALLERAEGNAFFLEEILRSLIASGVIVLENGRATFREVSADLHVPDTVQGVLASRIDRLAPEEKTTLQTAAVLGRVFGKSLLEEVIPPHDKGEALDSSLEALVHREFLRRPGADSAGASPSARADNYVFEHALTQQVSYESLLIAQRRELHRRAALAIEKLWPDRLIEQAAVLGQHYAKGELPEKALPYLSRAGERAAASYANAEAIGFYRQALDQIAAFPADADNLQRLLQSAELHERIADLLKLTAEHAEARKYYGRAAEIRRTVTGGEKASEARLLRKIAKTFEAEREFDEALRQLQSAEAALGDPHRFARADWEEWIETRLERFWSYYFRGRIAEMTEELGAIRNFVETYGTPRQRAIFSEHRVLLAYREERYDVSAETIALAQGALRLREESGELLPLGHAHFLLGLGYVSRGELTPAEEQLRAAEAIAHRTGDLTLLSRALTYLLLVARRRGDLAVAQPAAQRLLGLASRYGMREYIGVVKATTAWLAWRRRDFARLELDALEALRSWEGFRYPFHWLALWPLIAAAVAKGNTPEAIRFARQLLEPSQQRLPASLRDAVGVAVGSFEAGETDKAAMQLRALVGQATKLSYL